MTLVELCTKVISDRSSLYKLNKLEIGHDDKLAL